MMVMQKVLDHGHVRLVEHMGGDLSVARSARVSYDAEWRAGQDEGSDARLIKYLWRNGHTSPFESVVVTLDVKAPIFVFRQWHRHRTWSYNELSARYRELPEEYYVPAPEVVGVQSKSNKQARDIPLDQKDLDYATTSSEIIRAQCSSSFEAYRDLIERGVPRELARGVLPVNTYSHMFGTVNLLNLFKFLTLRVDPHAQYEIQQYGKAIVEIARAVAPVSTAAWEQETADGNLMRDLREKARKLALLSGGYKNPDQHVNLISGGTVPAWELYLPQVVNQEK